MYTVDRIEDNIVILEDRYNNENFEVRIEDFDYEVKEGDIVDLMDDTYIFNKTLTSNLKGNIRSKFDRLKK